MELFTTKTLNNNIQDSALITIQSFSPIQCVSTPDPQMPGACETPPNNLIKMFMI